MLRTYYFTQASASAVAASHFNIDVAYLHILQHGAHGVSRPSSH